MDHSHMNHGGMDHGDMGHGGGGMADMCNMNMLFTWDTTDLCILWKGWHIRGPVSLVFSLLAIVLFCASFEWFRITIREKDADGTRLAETVPRHRQVKIEQRSHAAQTVLFMIQTFWVFIVMLLFMTYNGFVWLAVTFGAGLGYYLFGKSTPAARENICH
ncbi:Ctr copper transporter family-domain-containing protein [Apiospora kogelbergensis]|uniref:Copper transport protein n=1 Tax=Apiospora kogelbergensis TaxID=1337665 RepID=A0AAW0QRL8_9PEZI